MKKLLFILLSFLSLNALAQDGTPSAPVTVGQAQLFSSVQGGDTTIWLRTKYGYARLMRYTNNTSYFNRNFKNPGTPDSPIGIQTDSAATNFNNFLLAWNANGDIVKLNANFSALTNTILYNGIKVQSTVPPTLGNDMLRLADSGKYVSQYKLDSVIAAHPSVNIGNSDLTLTGNRQLTGVNKTLLFQLNNGANHITSIYGDNTNAYLDYANNDAGTESSVNVADSTAFLLAQNSGEGSTRLTLTPQNAHLFANNINTSKTVYLDIDANLGAHLYDAYKVGLTNSSNDYTPTDSTYITKNYGDTHYVSSASPANIYNIDGTLAGYRTINENAQGFEITSNLNFYFTDFYFQGANGSNTPGISLDLENSLTHIAPTISVGPNNSYVGVVNTLTTKESKIVITSTDFTFTDNLNNKGPVAGGHYEANYTALSYVDKQYVDSLKSASGTITALTGDGTASGSGSVALTLATVNSNTGSWGDASHVATFTTNAKGLTTAAGQTSIQIAESQVTSLTSDLAGKLTTSNFVYSETPSGSINSSNTAYTLANTPVSGTVRIFRNGLRQVSGTDYTISGSSITYLYAPTTGDTLIADYQK